MNRILALSLLTIIAFSDAKGSPPISTSSNLITDSERANKYGKNKTILISYLTAISQFPMALFESLKVISEAGGQHSPGDVDNFESMSKCFRTDFEGSMISGALKVAIDDINNDPKLLPNHKLIYVYNNTCGDENQSARFFMEHWAQGAKLFIGPEMSCRTEATMAAAQNLPIISYKCKDEAVSDKKKYPTFARTVPAETEITAAFLALMQHYDWKKFSIIYENHIPNEKLLDSIQSAIEAQNEKLSSTAKRYMIININVVKHPFSEVGQTNIGQIIRDTAAETRTILFEMGLLGLMDRGEYALIYLDPDYNWMNVYHAMNNHFFRDTLIPIRQSWENSSSIDFMIVNYSKSAFAIIPTPVQLNAPEFINFWERANEHLHLFGVVPYGLITSMKASRFACYLYDAVKLYSSALTEVLNESSSTMVEGYDPISDGQRIIKKMLKRSYSSIQGFNVHMNENGDAKGSYTLLSLQKVDPVSNSSDPNYYPLNYALSITADFVYNTSSSLPFLKFRRNISWPSGKPPSDGPPCFFFGLLCSNDIIKTLLPVILSMLCISIFFFLGVFYRNYKLEIEIASIWKIEPKEIEKIIQCHKSSVSLYMVEENNNFQDTTETDAESVEDTDSNSYCLVALYKGLVVAVEEIKYSKKVKELTRAEKLEMRHMRQFHHDNINSFMGIVLRSTSIIVAREYCAKGTLMDVLSNNDLKLDTLFITSFVGDLIEGMIYLHNSELKLHGNLKSTTCFITSRWTLQVGDFGLYELRQDREWETNEIFWENLLWTAPELLLQGSECVRLLKGTQKGDVYSFGIILHEIMTRKGPFMMLEGDQYNAKEVVSKVMKDACFRPCCENLSAASYVIDVITKCWSKSTDERPDFYVIRRMLKPMLHPAQKRSIVDHMTAKMEKYQNQLEDIVNERTEALREEKQRTENLLLRMLPTPVAKQLLAGNDVTPETFTDVAIYFSDIVGFTSLSYGFSPMVVVDFLNKLYTLFDYIIKQYDVYKVETIGDAYMVVSGLPEKKSRSHCAEQISLMALHLLRGSENFVIPHRKDAQLKLRIGIHVGSCAAGVVGKTMPRYCLFGETVNIASRMESSGAESKIHCSKILSDALPNDDLFEIEHRGSVYIKGIGMMQTCWLLGHKNSSFSDDHTIGESENEKPYQRIFPRSIVCNISSSSGSNKGSLILLAGKNTSLVRQFIEKATVCDGDGKLVKTSNGDRSNAISKTESNDPRSSSTLGDNVKKSSVDAPSEATDTCSPLLLDSNEKKWSRFLPLHFQSAAVDEKKNQFNMSFFGRRQHVVRKKSNSPERSKSCNLTVFPEQFSIVVESEPLFSTENAIEELPD